MSRGLKSRPAAALAVIIALIVYAALLLWPYEWHGASFGNGAEVVAEGGVRFAEPGIALAKTPLGWVEAAMRTQALDLFLRFRSSVTEQTGPARLLTLSRDTFERNLMVGQEGRDLVIRVRLPGTDENGLIDKRPVARLSNMFPTADWVDLRISIAQERLLITLGGEAVWEEPLTSPPLDGWNDSYDLAMGNEVTCNRPWLGEIDQAIFRSGDVAIDHAAQDMIDVPSAIVITEKPPKLTLFRGTSLQDAVLNLALYIPLGLLLGLLIHHLTGRPRWFLVPGAMLFITIVSMTFEILQVLVPLRAPSIDDVIFNAIGGSVGVIAARAAGSLYLDSSIGR